MAAQGDNFTYFEAATAADVDRFVASTNMKVGAYTVANATNESAPKAARHVTVTVTAVGTADTMGTIVVTGTNLSGETITETLTPAAGSTVEGTSWFVTVTSVVGAGWVIDGVEASEDTITVGCAIDACVHEGDGVLKMVVLGEAAAGTVTLADSTGTIAVLKASVIEQQFDFGVSFSDYLTVTPVAATKVTVTTAA